MEKGSFSQEETDIVRQLSDYTSELDSRLKDLEGEFKNRVDGLESKIDCLSKDLSRLDKFYWKNLKRNEKILIFLGIATIFGNNIISLVSSIARVFFGL